MRKVLVLLTLVLLAPVAVAATAPNVRAVSGDLVVSNVLDSAAVTDEYVAAARIGDDGTVAAGFSIPMGVSSHSAGLLSLCTPSGQRVWSSTYTSFRGLDASFRFVAVAGGAIYVVGQLQVTAAANDVLLAKYTSQGGLAWLKTFEGSGHADDTACGLVIAKDGDPIVVSTEAMEAAPPASSSAAARRRTAAWCGNAPGTTGARTTHWAPPPMLPVESMWPAAPGRA